MFCPTCRDEFRPGFTHCARCDVDLVEALDGAGADAGGDAPVSPAVTPVRLVDFCGFMSLEDARGARDQLRQERIRTEVLIREPPEIDWEQPAREEFWIRVEASRLREVEKLLGDGAVAEEGAHFDCSECRHRVAETESVCPNCGARFDD